METALVFGSTGEIGSVLVDKLLKNNFKVITPVRELKKPTKHNADLPLHQILLEDFLCDPKAYLIDHISIVVNCAGMYIKDSTKTITKETFLDSIENNFFLVLDFYNATKAFISKNGSFVNIGSIASSFHSREELSYSLAKFAIDRFLLNESQTNNNFRVINIRPGGVHSKMTEGRKQKGAINIDDLTDTVIQISKQKKSLYISNIDIYGNRFPS